jgi:hypothetical protein
LTLIKFNFKLSDENVGLGLFSEIRRQIPMKIAQIAPLIESVPPRFYGGTERVVSYLTEELVRLGHDVTLFASSDSVTSARLRDDGAPSRPKRPRSDSLLHANVGPGP